jgi:hypothetical protein
VLISEERTRAISNFKRWFEKPLEAVRRACGADGGFVALGVSCPLYERYVMAIYDRHPYSEVNLEHPRKDENRNRIHRALMKDFDVSEKTAEVFWDVIRNGILHQSMPSQMKHKKPLPKYLLKAKRPRPIEMCEYEGEDLLMVDHWGFADKVIELWKNNIELIDNIQSFPWANIVTGITLDAS